MEVNGRPSGVIPGVQFCAQLPLARQGLNHRIHLLWPLRPVSPALSRSGSDLRRVCLTRLFYCFVRPGWVVRGPGVPRSGLVCGKEARR